MSGGGPSGQRFTDSADYELCSVHRRRRRKNELEDIPGQPGLKRCVPHRECHTGGQGGTGGGGSGGGGANAGPIPDNMAVCRIHNKRRMKMHLLEVAPGVYECVAPQLCKMVRDDAPNSGGGGGGMGGMFNPYGGPSTGGMMGMGMGGMGMMPFGAPGGMMGGMMMNNVAGGSGDNNNNNMAFAAMANMMGNFGGGAVASGGGNTAVGGSGVGGGTNALIRVVQQQQQQEMDIDAVWCCLHGKRLHKGHSVTHDGGASFQCRHATMCLGSTGGGLEVGTAESLAALLHKGCELLMCQRHRKLRMLNFLEYDIPQAGAGGNGAVVGFRCQKQHACVSTGAAEAAEGSHHHQHHHGGRDDQGDEFDDGSSYMMRR